MVVGCEFQSQPWGVWGFSESLSFCWIQVEMATEGTLEWTQSEELLERNGNSGNVGLSAASDILSISREILHSSSQFQSWESDPTQSIASGLNLLHTAAGCLVD